MNLGTQNEGNYIEPGLHDKDLRLCKFPQTNHKLPYTYLHLVMYLSTKCCSKSHFHLFAASFSLEADGFSQIVEEIKKSRVADHQKLSDSQRFFLRRRCVCMIQTQSVRKNALKLAPDWTLCLWPWIAEWAYTGIFAVAIQIQNQDQF